VNYFQKRRYIKIYQRYFNQLVFFQAKVFNTNLMRSVSGKIISFEEQSNFKFFSKKSSFILELFIYRDKSFIYTG